MYVVFNVTCMICLCHLIGNFKLSSSFGQYVRVLPISGEHNNESGNSDGRSGSGTDIRGLGGGGNKYKFFYL